MAVETECCDNGKVSAIAVSGNSNIINLCCDDTGAVGDGSNVPGTNDAGDTFADDVPMDSVNNSIPAGEAGGEEGWIGDSIFGVRCCLDDGAVIIRWTVEGIIELTRNDVPIFTSTGTETEYIDNHVLTGDTVYRLTAPNGVDKRILLKVADCLSCAPVYTLTVDCNIGTENSVILSAGGIDGTETIVFYRNTTEIGSGLISNLIDTPGVGAWDYFITVNGGNYIYADQQILLPEYCENEWSPWYFLDSKDFEGPDGPDRSSYWQPSGGSYAKHYCESGVITPPLVASGKLTQFEMKSYNFQPSTGDMSIRWYDAYDSYIDTLFTWYGNGDVFTFNGQNIAGFRLQNSAVGTIGTQARPIFTCQYRYRL